MVQKAKAPSVVRKQPVRKSRMCWKRRLSDISLKERVPASHHLRKLRTVVDALLATMDREFEAVYARRGRPSVPPEMRLKALQLQILFSIRSERQWVEAIDHNLLYRWFVGLNIDDKVWRHSPFSTNCERLFNEDRARAFFERVTRPWTAASGGTRATRPA